MRSYPDSTVRDLESIRSEIAFLTRQLSELRDRLIFQARAIDVDGPAVLPRIYRGTVETVCVDLLDDAVSTLTRLGVV